ncbi:COMM domain-containing protein 3-like [Belonocnema kinseyi]|uniref:COMM domain-containing protein 3-like n=1 Tax=Belonocnema kinseyi TaxID=2817044 RepID=UPI00143D5FEF|nr:COMM domain-containing protein 3-like [Belonocnema kinseyi]
MEFSDDSIKKIINNHGINLLNDETFDNLLSFAVTRICEEATDKTLAEIYGSEPDLVKNAYTGITSLFVEAARHDLGIEKLSESLNSSSLNKEKIEKLCEAFEKNKERFKHKLEIVGGGLPHLVDVTWKLDYCIKSNSTDSVGMPIYHVSLQTTKYGDSKFLKFTCTLQQLQELVHKLKDAVRHMEKLAN